jgi:hypothetical protein
MRPLGQAVHQQLSAATAVRELLVPPQGNWGLHKRQEALFRCKSANMLPCTPSARKDALPDSVLRLFQVWASKHVLGIAGTMKFLSHEDGRKPICPSCLTCEETCSHIARCLEAGRTAAFQQSVSGITSWMADNATIPDVKAVVTAYTLGRGRVTCAACAD